MTRKKRKPLNQETARPENKPKPVVSQSKQPLFVVALVAFCLGFLSGVGFTVYKSGSTSAVPMTQTAQGETARDETAKMELALELAAKENPDSADTWIRLGNIYFDTARHQLAIEAYEKSLALAPNNANVLTDLGVMYRRSDRPNEAIASFDRAIAVNPKHETARFNKGIVLLHDLGDEKGAIKAWENLVEVNPVAVTPSGISVDEMVTEMKKQAGKTDG